MTTLTVLKTFGPIDARNIWRDALLRWLAVLPIILALGARWFFPLIFGRIEVILGVPILPYYPVLMNFGLLLLAPLLAGTVIGFLLLDQRDDGTLTALRVTPLRPAAYLAYRLALPTLLSFGVTLLALPLAGLVPLSPGGLLLSALAAAPQAPLFALLLAGFARNKVQGFALMKGSSIMLVPPLIAYFIEPPWQWLFGLVPTYWPARVLWLTQAGRPEAWLYGLVGLLYQGLLLWVLLRRFERI